MRKVYLFAVLIFASIVSASPDLTVSNPQSFQSTSSGAISSAVPARADYAGAISSGNLAGIIQCDKSVTFNSVTAATTQLVALNGSQVIYVCGYSLVIQGVVTTPASWKLVYGTGASCATGLTDLTGTLTGSTVAGSALSFNAGGGLGSILRTPAGNALCMTTATVTLKSGVVWYSQF